MEKYFLGNNRNNSIYGEINEKEYRTFLKFYTLYKRYENFCQAFLVSNDSKIEYEDLKKSVELEKNVDLDKLHVIAIGVVTRYVLTNRMAVDNAKAYYNECSINNSFLIDKEKNNQSFAIFKILRNYAQHYSIPISNTTVVLNILTNTSKVEFSISKEEILQNNFRGKDREYIVTSFPETIIFEEITEECNRVMDELFLDITEKTKIKVKKRFIKLLKNRIQIFTREHDGRTINALFVKKEGDPTKVYCFDEKIFFGFITMLSSRFSEVW